MEIKIQRLKQNDMYGVSINVCGWKGEPIFCAESEDIGLFKIDGIEIRSSYDIIKFLNDRSNFVKNNYKNPIFTNEILLKSKSCTELESTCNQIVRYIKREYNYYKKELELQMKYSSQHVIDEIIEIK